MIVNNNDPVETCTSTIDLQCSKFKAILQQLIIDPDSERRHDLVTAGTVALLKIKVAHRGAYEAAEVARVATGVAKNALESGALQLANLAYQRSHHEAEIAACLDDRSAFSAADLALLSEEEFIAETGDQWAGEMDGDRRHAFNIARLKHEQATRQALQSGLHKAKAHKVEVTSRLALKRRFLAGLTAEVNAIRDAGAPLTGMLSFAPAATQLPPRCEELPLPLFILASNLAERQCEGRKVNITIIDSNSSPKPDTTSGTPADVDMTPNGRGGKDGNDQEEEEGAIPDVNPAEATTAADATMAARDAEAEASSLDSASEAGDQSTAEGSALDSAQAVDPLAVQLALGPTDTAQLLVTFSYSPKRHTVLAAGDNATSSRALAHAAASQDAKTRSSSRKGTPPVSSSAPPAGPQAYRWVQHLAGIDFLPAPSPEAPRASVATADGNVLAALWDYRSSGRAAKALELLCASYQAVVGTASGAAAAAAAAAAAVSGHTK